MNNKNKNSIDDLFSEKLQNHSVKPRDLVWENLDKALDKKKGKSYGKYWFLGTVLFALTLGGGTVFFWNSIEQENQVIGQNPKIEIQQEKQKIIDNLNSKNKQKIVINKKENQKQNPAITTNKIYNTSKKAINLSTKEENKTIQTALNQENTKKEEKEEVATFQNSQTAEKASTEQQDIETQNKIQNLDSLQTLENLEGDIEKEEEITATVETEVEKQETKKAGVHLKIRLGTQAGGRDEEREEIEAEERANKKANLFGKVLKGAWNLKKEKQLGKKNNKLKKN